MGMLCPTTSPRTFNPADFSPGGFPAPHLPPGPEGLPRSERGKVDSDHGSGSGHSFTHRD